MATADDFTPLALHVMFVKVMCNVHSCASLHHLSFRVVIYAKSYPQRSLCS